MAFKIETEETHVRPPTKGYESRDAANAAAIKMRLRAWSIVEVPDEVIVDAEEEVEEVEAKPRFRRPAPAEGRFVQAARNFLITIDQFMTLKKTNPSQYENYLAVTAKWLEVFSKEERGRTNEDSNDHHP